MSKRLRSGPQHSARGLKRGRTCGYRAKRLLGGRDAIAVGRHAQDDVLLGREVAKERHGGNPGSRRDVLRRRLLVAVRGDEPYAAGAQPGARRTKPLALPGLPGPHCPLRDTAPVVPLILPHDPPVPAAPSLTTTRSQPP